MQNATNTPTIDTACSKQATQVHILLCFNQDPCWVLGAQAHNLPLSAGETHAAAQVTAWRCTQSRMHTCTHTCTTHACHTNMSQVAIPRKGLHMTASNQASKSHWCTPEQKSVALIGSETNWGSDACVPGAPYPPEMHPTYTLYSCDAPTKQASSLRCTPRTHPNIYNPVAKLGFLPGVHGQHGNKFIN